MAKKVKSNKIYSRDIDIIELKLMGSKVAEIKKCSRCKSKKLNWRLDGSRYCKNCGQRISSKGDLIPSFDRRVFHSNNKKINSDNEMIEEDDSNE